MRTLRTLVGMSLLAVLIAIGCAAFPVSVVDDRGIEVVIASDPARIVSLNALYAQIIVDLGLTDRLVAVATSDDNPSEVAGLPTVGAAFSPNVELILGYEPDLVLGANDWGGERDALESADVTVLTTPWLTDVLSIFDTVRTISAALGVVEDGDRLIGQIATDIIVAEAAALGQAEVSAAFLYAATSEDPPYAAGSDAIEHELILRAGGSNVFEELVWSPQVSFEEIIARDPEVIFTAPSQVSNILDNPFLQSVRAVKNGRVVGVPASDVASTRVASALQAIVDGLHDAGAE